MDRESVYSDPELPIVDELSAIINEFRRYRIIGEKSIARLDEDALNQLPAEETNSAAMLVRHISGNLQSRFTNFLTEDGEKPWRDRDAEFVEMRYDRGEVEQIWADGWRVLESALDQLSLDDMNRIVHIRAVPLTVHEALARSIAHVAYHVGQLVLIARLLTKAGKWKSLSIPRGQSAAYNTGPVREKKP